MLEKKAAGPAAHVLANGQAVEKLHALEGPAEPAVGAVTGAVPVERLLAEPHTAGRRPVPARAGVEERRLTGAVGADEPGDRAALARRRWRRRRRGCHRNAPSHSARRDPRSRLRPPRCPRESARRSGAVPGRPCPRGSSDRPRSDSSRLADCRACRGRLGTFSAGQIATKIAAAPKNTPWYVRGEGRVERRVDTDHLVGRGRTSGDGAGRRPQIPAAGSGPGTR